MKKAITSYQDLVNRKLELQRQLDFKKQQIRNDFLELKEELQPALNVASLVGKVTTRDTRSNVVLQTGANLAIDWVTRKVFPKSGFLFKILGPLLMKNYASHLLNKSGANNHQ
jgi:hypothetical protein